MQYPDDTRLNEISQSPATDTKQKERIFIESRPIVQAIDIPDALISDYSGSMEDEARTLTQTGDHAGAVAIWKGILSNSPKSPEVWRGLADALLAAGYPDRYEQCNRRADSLDDEHRTSLEEQQPVDEIGSISLIDAVENVREAAVDVVEDRGDIDEAISWFNMGTNLLNEGNNEEALTSFEKAIGACPKDETEFRM